MCQGFKTQEALCARQYKFIEKIKNKKLTLTQFDKLLLTRIYITIDKSMWRNRG